MTRIWRICADLNEEGWTYTEAVFSMLFPIRANPRYPRHPRSILTEDPNERC
jgi:hypothetical protein